MDNQQLLQQMTPVFREVFDDERLVVAPSTTAADVENWDSLANIRLMVALEIAFNVRLNASEIAKLANVGELTELIRSKL